MEVLAAVRGDRKGLFHKTIRLVTVAIRSTVRVWIGLLHAVAIGIIVEVAATTLALHLTVG
jgi:hypothetical protein